MRHHVLGSSHAFCRALHKDAARLFEEVALGTKRAKALTCHGKQDHAMEAARAILRKHWGYPAFRPLQEDVIQAVLDRYDVLALMPTSGGKSICFQVPALMREGVCLVISPLIALMQDQVAGLRTQGIPAAALHTGMSPQEMDIVLDNCVHGKTKLLYLSPERLHTPLFRTRMQQMHVTLLVVDEAHCISQWGHDFRPAYHAIASLRSLVPNLQTVALTATATTEVKQDIMEQLALRSPVVLQQSFARPNLAFAVRQVENPSHALYHLLRQSGGSAIVYAPTRRTTQWIAQYLQEKEISATCYHAGLSPQVRTQRQNAWLKDAVRVMVATNAFGMGIHKPNVRLVAHLHFPSTLEAYYQEAGRAGRDGRSAQAIVLYEAQAIEKLPQKVAAAHPDARVLKAMYQRLANYYQVAIGSHADVTYPFDLEDFTHTYGMQATQVHAALQRLQEAGLLQYSTPSAKPTQVHVTLGAQQLYAFQVSNPAYRPLIVALQHSYGTYIFTQLTSCSLKRLAKQLQTTEKRLHHQLQGLHDLGVLTYIPAKQHPTLTFLTSRYAPENLPIHAKKLRARREVMIQKAQAVLHYMQHPQRCRMQILLEYLGEIAYDRCAICDLCQASRQAAFLDPDRQPQAEQAICTLLKQKNLTPKALVEALEGEIPKKDILSMLRTLLTRGKVVYQGTDTLALAAP